MGRQRLGHRQGFDRAGHDSKRDAARITFSRQFWFDITDVLDHSDRKTTRGNVAMTSERRFEVLDLVSLSLPGPWWWRADDMNDPGAVGATFTCYEEKNPVPIGYLVAADVSKDPDEPDISVCEEASVPELDQFLESEGRRLLAQQGREIIRWMSSRLNSYAL
jgi:hypothetical protein